MYNHIWFIDTQHPVSDVVIGKQIVLAKAFNSQVSVVIDQRTRSMERRFWQTTDFFESADRLHRKSVDEIQAKIERHLINEKISYRIFISEQKLYRQAIERAISECSENLILIAQKPQISQHAIYQDLASLPCSVLMLTEKNWSSELRMAAAVDPMHENARPEELDSQIVEMTQEFEEKLKTKWWLVHCCYLSPMFLEYKHAIKEIHFEGLEQFAERSGIAVEKLRMLDGIPERILPAWVEKQQIDVLVLGLVARNPLMAHLIGSTTTALLTHQPCDMLMVTSASVQ